MKKRRKINRGATLTLALVAALIVGLSVMAVANGTAKPVVRKALDEAVDTYCAQLLLPKEYRPANAEPVPEAVLEDCAKKADEALSPRFAETGKTYDTTLRRLGEQLKAQTEDEMTRLVSLERSVYYVDYKFEPALVNVTFYYEDTLAYASAPSADVNSSGSGSATFRKVGGEWKLLYLSMTAPSEYGGWYESFLPDMMYY